VSGQRRAAQAGQATVEWVGLVAFVALALALLGAIAGMALPGAALARAVGGKIVCAISLDRECGLEPTPLIAAYGDALAALVAEHAPQIRYERGMRALPVDYRDCREDACAEGSAKLRVWKTESGLPVVSFTHVIDCRAGAAPAPPGADCSGEAAGNLYLQYWLYYPGSATGEGSIVPGVVRQISDAVGKPSFHPDDWESLQLRIHPDGEVDSRASAHHGYGPGWLPVSRAGYTVSGGSHAGTVGPADFARITPAARLTLIPLEPIAAAHPGTAFAITPPWLKKVWLDPDYAGTD
jgi:hypothetical protein